MLENLLLTDSTKVEFSLFEKGIKKQQIKLYPQILNNARKFLKPYRPKQLVCPLIFNNEAVTADDLPQMVKNTIMLEEVEIKADAKALKYKRAPGNSQLRGYKITDTESRGFFYILDYIRYHGFDVTNNGVNVGIYGRTTNTINGQRTQPMVYIDNMYVMSFDVLQNIQTGDVDEFYVNQHAVVPSVNNKMGIIRIFMKKGFTAHAKSITDTSYIVKNGFTKNKPFENVVYATTSGKGFDSYGLVDWQPLILPEANGEFTIKIPKTSQKAVKVLIEGFSADGKLISEIKTIEVN